MTETSRTKTAVTGFAYTDGYTPIERYGDLLVKRDDLYMAAGAPGGKARTCWTLSRGATGLITASSRASPQLGIVARIANYLGIPCRAHMPEGDSTPEMDEAREFGAQIVQHKAGYNTVIIARARQDASDRGWREIPFGMECQAAVDATSRQVPRELPADVKRIVVPVGSAMSLAGILWGLRQRIPVLGISVGAEPRKRLDKWAPPMWTSLVDLVTPGVDYHHGISTTLHGIKLDPIYEAKCAKFLRPGDLFWIVGIRGILRK